MMQPSLVPPNGYGYTGAMFPAPPVGGGVGVRVVGVRVVVVVVVLVVVVVAAAAAAVVVIVVVVISSSSRW